MSHSLYFPKSSTGHLDAPRKPPHKPRRLAVTGRATLETVADAALTVAAASLDIVPASTASAATDSASEGVRTFRQLNSLKLTLMSCLTAPREYVATDVTTPIGTAAFNAVALALPNRAFWVRSTQSPKLSPGSLALLNEKSLTKLSMNVPHQEKL